MSRLPLEGASDSLDPASGNSVPSHSGRGVSAFLAQASDLSAGLGAPSSLAPARHSQSGVLYRGFVHVSRNQRRVHLRALQRASRDRGHSPFDRHRWRHYDNSFMESIIGVFKTECIRTDVFYGGPYRQLADVEFATAGWVDWWNNRRLHGTRRNLTPAEYARAYCPASVSEPQPA
ncbi:integrase core domain-containing protein [Nesterenkonia sp. LB17]|uniref:integrase core domain-containing protein n=1 Tax=Nesterenkonia sp. LB17 TaxID=2901230 RepID=UPI00351D2FC2